MENDWYLGFDADSGTFAAAKSDSSNPSLRNIYLWRKSNLPTTYTTVAEGQELTADDLEITDIDAYVGEYRHINVCGLKEITGVKYVGGLVGLADTASVTSLLGDTVGAGKFEKFDFSEIYARGSLEEGLTVTGSDYYVGGFAGCVGPGELLGTGGLNVQLLGLSLIKANNLLSLGEGLETKIDSVTVSGVTAGCTVEETGTAADDGLTTYCAGGFFGRSNSAVVNNCRAVNLQWVRANDDEGRAGGFLGVSEVGGLASMDDAEGTRIKSLLQADSLLNAIGWLIPEYTKVDTTFVNGGYVQGAYAGGFAADFQSGTVDNSAKANDDWYAVYNVDHVTGTLYAGCSGGFAGALLDGSVKNSHVENLSEINALNYGGGFVGHSGKSGLADVDGADIAGLAALNAGVGDSFGSYIKSSTVTGVDSGYTVTAAGGHETVAGGFVGYADLAKIGVRDALVDAEAEADLACAAENLKYVSSEQIAGGFVGKTTKGYLGELQASSPVAALLLDVVNVLVRALYLPEAERADFLNLNLAGLVGVELLSEGNLLGVNLLGIQITVALGTKEDEGGATDVAKITIGDSCIELPCNENGLIDPEHSNLTIRLIPLFYTTIYYEDDFVTFTGGKSKDNADVSWVTAGAAQNGEQQEDRPGADVMDYNNIYGYDDQYSESAAYSLGSAQMITVSKGMTQWPAATFTFTGTGFDVLAVTDKTTGYMLLELYRVDPAAGTETILARRGVDTFYGCTREEDGYIRYLCVWDETAQVWRVAKTACPDMTDEEAAGKAGTTEDGCMVKAEFPTNDDPDYAAHTSFIVYKKNYVWTTNGTNSTLYQVPVISTRSLLLEGETLAYGTYKVVLKPQYAAYFDHDKADDSYTLYIDGVRVYGPAQDLDTDYYLQDHEGWPQFLEMRKLLLDQGEFGQTRESGSIVYIDGGIIARDLSEFRQYGPNNEIYLDPGQAIGFTLQKGASAEVDRVHVSLKRVFAGEAKVSFTSGTQDDPRSTELPLNTASECYYDLSSVIRWDEDGTTGLIVIANTGSSTVSLRNLKITYRAAVSDTDDLVSVAPIAPDGAAAALGLLRRSAALPVVLDDDPAFLGASISLESDFSLHFYIPAELLEGKTNPYVLFTKQTGDGPVTVCQYDWAEETVGGVLCRRYTFRNLSAAEMGAEVTARLFYNDEGTDHMSAALTYSVKQYAMNMLAKTDDAALRTLLVDMLNYGAEAQAYFGVNADKPVNADLSDAQRAWATAGEPALENHKELIRRDGAKVWFEGCSLSLERMVTINYYLDLSGAGLSANETELELTWQEADGSRHTAVIDGSAFETRKDRGRTLYVAVLEELNAAQMRTVVSAVLRRKTDQTCLSDTMCYSIESYARSKADKDPALAPLILAMMKYGDAAEAYFSAH